MVAIGDQRLPGRRFGSAFICLEPAGGAAPIVNSAPPASGSGAGAANGEDAAAGATVLEAPNVNPAPPF